jgi:hypothetical protein
MKQELNNQKTDSNRLIEFIPEKEAFKLLNISRSTLWRLRMRLLVKCYRIEGSKRNYYKISEINAAFIEID